MRDIGGFIRDLLIGLLIFWLTSSIIGLEYRRLCPISPTGSQFPCSAPGVMTHFFAFLECRSNFKYGICNQNMTKNFRSKTATIFWKDWNYCVFTEKYVKITTKYFCGLSQKQIQTFFDVITHIVSVFVVRWDKRVVWDWEEFSTYYMIILFDVNALCTPKSWEQIMSMPHLFTFMSKVVQRCPRLSKIFQDFPRFSNIAQGYLRLSKIV